MTRAACYLRTIRADGDLGVIAAVARVQEFAARQRFSLQHYLHDVALGADDSVPSAFLELLDLVADRTVAVVLVPSEWHLSPIAAIRESRAEAIRDRGGTLVVLTEGSLDG